VFALSTAMCAACLCAEELPPPPVVAPSSCADAAAAVPTNVALMSEVNLTLEGPGAGREQEKSAKVTGEFAFTATKPASFPVLDSTAVLTGFDLGSRYLRLVNGPAGYSIEASEEGDYRVSLKYLAPVDEKDGLWSLRMGIPPTLKNRIVLRLPEKDLDVRSEQAVYLAKSEPEAGGTVVTASLGPVQNFCLSWRPRVRKTKLEKVAFFCEANTYALFEPGVVEVTSLVRFQIAQGELKTVTLSVPEGMSVTSVSAPGLATWRFDPDGHALEAVLEKPVSGDFTLMVVAQIPREGLPYEAAIGALSVRDADRQHGSLALSVPETVQISADKMVGLAAMNIADFSPETVRAVCQGPRAKEAPATKRAFRYHQLPASVVVKAERVLPELKVEERSSLSVSDERIVLSSQLAVTVAKAGVFFVRLDIPDNFDVETLTGEDVSHWDEVRDGGRGVVVHFQKQAMGTRTLNLAMARAEKGIEASIVAPRITVRDAHKHTGTLVVSGERGLRMTTQARDGVSELNPRELGIREFGPLAFRILRPDWQVTIRTEVLSPTVKPELLHRIDLAEGTLRGLAYIQYTIENAGCKTFRLQAPQPGVSLTITGKNVAKVFEADKERGIWQVDLHGKVEQNVLLRASYQIPFDPARPEVKIVPLRTLDTEGQKGYLVVMSTGRVQVSPTGEMTGLKPEDARSIPPAFGAGDLSDAILCYRTVLPEYQLNLAARRHGSAYLLPAQVKQVRMTSVVSADGQMVTQVLLDVDIGNLRYLELSLPERGDRLWSVFINGKVAKPSLEKQMYRIPLRESPAGETTSIDLVYAGHEPEAGGRSQALRGPKFNLPLNNVLWRVYLQPGLVYYDFGGTFQLMEKESVARNFDQRIYTVNNLRQVETDLQKAKVVMARGEQYAREGKQKEAKQALETAMNYSQPQADFNEDARIQYRNLAKQQAFVGLVQRRNEMRMRQNIQDEQQAQQMRGFQDGQFTAEYAQQVQQALPAEENTSLQVVAEKILDQQEAAAAVTHAMRVTMPEQGTRLIFHRPVQINANAEMTVTFRALNLAPLRWMGSLWAGLAVLAGAWVVTGRRRN
jgi:hypothetical protein